MNGWPVACACLARSRSVGPIERQEMVQYYIPHANETKSPTPKQLAQWNSSIQKSVKNMSAFFSKRDTVDQKNLLILIAFWHGCSTTFLDFYSLNCDPRNVIVGIDDSLLEKFVELYQ